MIPKIQATKNYRLFKRNTDNRETDVKRHRGLVQSMKDYGFLSCFPIICNRDKSGDLVVRDGQHRLMIAESLGISVFYIVVDYDFDIPAINNAAKGWTLRDYAVTFAHNGLKDYQEAIEFADHHNLPLGTAFVILAGVSGFRSIRDAFASGQYKIKDREYAETVATIYVRLIEITPVIRRGALIEGCLAVGYVPELDINRLIAGAKACPEKLVPYSTRDAWVDALESIYNFRRRELFPLKNRVLTILKARKNDGLAKATSVAINNRKSQAARKANGVAKQAAVTK